ncbi:hypothetical protein EXS57_00690 [Candidatus Kaiserbacteria bacterium]|nr:hypothetical protein [Candidatus Kaiserbacteria bacterium]
MIRDGLLTIASFVSTMILPWPFTIVLALVAGFFEPLIPFAIGIFADTLYYAPGAGAVPLYSVYGLVVSLVITFVRSQLHSSTIR